MIKLKFPIMLLAVVASSALGAPTTPYPNITMAPGDDPSGERWYQQCLRVRDEAPPAADRLSDRNTGQWKDCPAIDLYYDAKNAPASQHPDWQQVRLCALATQDFSVLMMLYANGEGVSQNIKLATKYACSIDSATAEMEERVLHLNRHPGARTKENFDFCDDITSGYMQGVCAAIYERQREKIRNAQLASYVKNWTTAQQEALQTLKGKLRDFADHRAQDETDLGGTARAALQIEAQSNEHEQFVRDIRQIAECKPPQNKRPSSGVSDRQLQRLLRAVTNPRQQDRKELGTIEPDGIERTQQTWQAYRDAWHQMVVTKCPDSDPKTWLSVLAARRIAQLSAFR